RRKPVTELEWAGCDDPLSLLDHLEGTGWVGERKMRLFACACCRRIGHLLPDAAVIAVAVAECLADQEASEADREAVAEGIEFEDSATVAAAAACSSWTTREQSYAAARDAVQYAALAQAFHHRFITQDFVAEGTAVLSAERVVQAQLLRDIVG